MGQEEADRKVIVAALRTAIEAYETNEKTFRQAVEDIKNGRDVPMFVRGEPGMRIAKSMADKAYTQARDAREVLKRWDPNYSEAEAGS